MPRSPNGEYARVYFSVLDDPKFESIYSDDAAFATWVRLLILAEMAWPASAPLPRSATDEVLARLTDAGLIDLSPGDRFRVHGLDAERQQRSSLAREAAVSRWQANKDNGGGHSGDLSTDAPSNADGNADGNPNGNAEVMLGRGRGLVLVRERGTTTTPSTTSESVERATSRAPARGAARQVTMTREQLEAWRSFGPEWDAFKEAWTGRGFLWPPYGSPDDGEETNSQRNVLWTVLDARPRELVRIVRDHPGKTPREVIAAILNHWHSVRDEVADDPGPYIEPRNSVSRRGPMTPIGALLGGDT